MPSLAVIGCGNIGSRLLQSAAQAPVEGLEIHGVEPFESARALSAERFAEVSDRGHALRMVEGPDALPDTVDLLIVACSAHQRMDALRGALAHTTPRAVVLEKTLFTRLSDYDRAAELLDGIPTFVNTTRNIWPGYRDLAGELGDGPVAVTVDGTDWNLGSNGIHYLSMAEFVTGATVETVEIENASARDSKRDGYRDLTGTLRATLSDGSTVTLHSRPQAGDARHPIRVHVVQGDREWDIVEGEQVANGRPFPMLFASQLGEALAEIVERRTSGLPTLAESTRLHRVYLRALQPHIHPETVAGQGDADLCMVT